MLENAYQAKLIKKLRSIFPGCIILKNDSSYMQGVPDLSIFYYDRWAMLEVKASANEPTQPNQEWYVSELSKMSYAAFIYPENEEDILNDLQHALQPSGKARVPKR